MSLALGVSLTACKDNPGAGSSPSQCPSTCPVQWCNPITFECEPPDTGSDDATEPIEVGDDAGSTEDSGQGGGDVGEDAVEEVDLEEQADVDDEVAEGDDTAGTDVGEDDEDLGDEPDIHDDPAQDEPDVEADLPTTLCPDRLEPSGIDNPVHLNPSSALVATVDQCSEELWDPQHPTGCVCDGTPCCQCGINGDLALCGTGDQDLYTFDLLAGDVATVRIIPDVQVERCDFFAELTWPSGDTRLSTCEIENRQVMAVIPISPASTADGDPGVIGRYSVRVRSAVEDTIPYRIHVQVEPISRGCPADAWDAAWPTYNELLGSEVKCSEEGCTAPLTNRSDLAAVRGQICPWDRIDMIRHVVAGDTFNDRVIRLKFDENISQMSGTLYWTNVLGQREPLTNVCPACETRICETCDNTVVLGDGSLQASFVGLPEGTYQLEVKANHSAPAVFDVFFFDE